MTVVRLIELPTHLMADRFEDFVKTRYLKAIHEGATRVGLIKSISILRRRRLTQDEPIDLDRNFLMLEEWSGVGTPMPRLDDAAVQQLFDSFNAKITELGEYGEVASRELADM